MNLEILAIIAFVMAAVPCGLFLANLSVYRRLARQKSTATQSVSVLIPARNEEPNIRATLQA
ncbi:MAG: glycosyl transferase, partial [Verrucomicrobiota bacterium]